MPSTQSHTHANIFNVAKLSQASVFYCISTSVFVFLHVRIDKESAEMADISPPDRTINKGMSLSEYF